ncbi:MAG: hypothetical protein Q8K86_04145 [Candidatus Nanopelagicaceae bacterium]|nr:hypothetical protein [Candidatus Nanopelagicaceae bacterium]
MKHLSVDRLSSYLESTKGATSLALALYQWNSSVSSAMFHVLGDVEVVVRNAHHEPIHNRDIARDYQVCIEVLNAISPIIAAWSVENSRVLGVLAEKPL